MQAVREGLVLAIHDSGCSVRRGCEILLLSQRRYYRWVLWKEPKKRQAWNKLRPVEEAAIFTAAKDEKLSDLRAAGLMVNGHDTNSFYCSQSIVQKTLKKHVGNVSDRNKLKENKKILQSTFTRFIGLNDS